MPLSHHTNSLGSLDMVPDGGGGGGGGAAGGGGGGGGTAMMGLEEGSCNLHRTHSASNVYSGDFPPTSAMMQPSFSSHPSLSMLGNMNLPSPILNSNDDFMDVTGSPSLGRSPLLVSEQEHQEEVFPSRENAVTGHTNSALPTTGDQQQEQQQQQQEQAQMQKGMLGV